MEEKRYIQRKICKDICVEERKYRRKGGRKYRRKEMQKKEKKEIHMYEGSTEERKCSTEETLVEEYM